MVTYNRLFISTDRLEKKQSKPAAVPVGTAAGCPAAPVERAPRTRSSADSCPLPSLHPRPSPTRPPRLELFPAAAVRRRSTPAVVRSLRVLRRPAVLLDCHCRRPALPRRPVVRSLRVLRRPAVLLGRPCRRPALPRRRSCRGTPSAAGHTHLSVSTPRRISTSGYYYSRIVGVAPPNHFRRSTAYALTVPSERTNCVVVVQLVRWRRAGAIKYRRRLAREEFLLARDPAAFARATRNAAPTPAGRRHAHNSVLNPPRNVRESGRKCVGRERSMNRSVRLPFVNAAGSDRRPW